jgi:ribosome-associated heat shock protein Hsp15
VSRSAADDGVAQPALRADKWLVHARFAKTRSGAVEMVECGRLRVNGRKADKPDARLRIGDVLTITLVSDVVVLRVRALGERRTSPSLARMLYDVLDGGNFGVAESAAETRNMAAVDGVSTTGGAPSSGGHSTG